MASNEPAPKWLVILRAVLVRVDYATRLLWRWLVALALLMVLVTGVGLVAAQRWPGVVPYTTLWITHLVMAQVVVLSGVLTVLRLPLWALLRLQGRAPPWHWPDAGGWLWGALWLLLLALAGSGLATLLAQHYGMAEALPLTPQHWYLLHTLLPPYLGIVLVLWVMVRARRVLAFLQGRTP